MGGKTHQQFAFLIEDLHRLLRKRYQRSARSGTLSYAQGRVFTAISRNQGITQTALADRLEISKIALTHLVDQLEVLDLVERRVDEKDRRVRRLFLTEAAKPRVEAVWNFLGEVSDEVLSVLPRERASTFVEDLQRVHERMKMEQEENGKN